MFELAFIIALWAVCSLVEWHDKRTGKYPRSWD